MSYQADESYGVTWQSGLSLTVTALVCFTFVHDTDLAVAASSVESTGEELAMTAQQALDT